MPCSRREMEAFPARVSITAGCRDEKKKVFLQNLEVSGVLSGET
jgi:hypothetical protein